MPLESNAFVYVSDSSITGHPFHLQILSSQSVHILHLLCVPPLFLLDPNELDPNPHASLQFISPTILDNGLLQ